MPPNKRTNFIKFGFPSPFRCSWALITKEWCPVNAPSPFFVLRNKRELRQLHEYVENNKRNRKITSISLQPGALVPVSVIMLGNGCLTPFSHICVPTESDLRARISDRKFAGPLETPHVDHNEKKRKLLRMTHARELKRLRRRRIKIKKLRLQNGIPAKITKRKHSPTEEIVQTYHKASRELWIPPDVTNLRNYCNREICGFVISCGFSLLQGCTTGQGYLTSESLAQLLDLQRRLKCDLTVLTRAPNSLSYRFCSLNIIL